jgi:3-hydroxyisobutyrate dehydrogenase
MKAAFLGLGVMGEPMARNLLKGGFALSVWNRTRAKAERLSGEGARVSATPREAALEADFVVSMVSDDAASRGVWLGDDGALAGAPQGALLIECSTLSLAWVRELSTIATDRGFAFLDSPVAGSTDAAAAGSLNLFVGGEAAVLERARPVLEKLSASINHMGPGGAGALMKLINNQMLGVQALALAEALAFAERAGLSMEQVVPLIQNGAGGSPTVKRKAPMMAERQYAVQFAMKWLHKDLGYALAAADQHGAPLPAVATAHEVFRMARNAGHADKDFAALIEVLRAREN